MSVPAATSTRPAAARAVQRQSALKVLDLLFALEGNSAEDWQRMVAGTFGNWMDWMDGCCSMDSPIASRLEQLTSTFVRDEWYEFWEDAKNHSYAHREELSDEQESLRESILAPLRERMEAAVAQYRAACDAPSATPASSRDDDDSDNPSVSSDD